MLVLICVRGLFSGLCHYQVGGGVGQLDWGVGMFSKGFSIAVVGSFIEIALLLGVTLKM